MKHGKTAEFPIMTVTFSFCLSNVGITAKFKVMFNDKQITIHKYFL